LIIASVQRSWYDSRCTTRLSGNYQNVSQLLVCIWAL